MTTKENHNLNKNYFICWQKKQKKKPAVLHRVHKFIKHELLILCIFLILDPET